MFESFFLVIVVLVSCGCGERLLLCIWVLSEVDMLVNMFLIDEVVEIW